MSRNRIVIEFESDRPLTQDDQDAMLAEITNAIHEPVTIRRTDDGIPDGYTEAEWRNQSIPLIAPSFGDQ